MNFKELYSAAQKAPFEVLEIVCGAAENADDTIPGGDRSSPEWLSVAQASVESILADGKHSKATVRWFTKRGVRF